MVEIKRIAFCLVCFILLSSLSETLVTISAKNEKMYVVMAIIEKQTGAVFSYNPKIIDVEQKVSVEINKKNLTEAVSILLGQKFKYSIKGKYIILLSETEPLYYAQKQSFKEKNEKTNENITIENSGKLNDTCINSIASEIILDSIKDPKFVSLIVENLNQEDIMFKKIASIIAISTFTAGTIDATPPKEEFNVKEKKERVVLEKSLGQVSFFYPLGTSGAKSKETDYKFSFNILGGITGDVRAVELGGIFNINKQDVSGVQLSGVFNITEGSINGFQGAEVFNIVREDVRGVQLSGVFNYAGNVKGAQVSGVFNRAEAVEGMQLSGVVNYAKSAKTQIGVVNVTKSGKFQFGVLNIRDTANGAMLGVINIAKKGGVLDIGLAGSEFMEAGVYFKTGTKKLYSIISIARSSEKVFGIGFGLGTTLYQKNKLSINLEAMHHNLYNNKFSSKKYNGLVQILPGVRYNFSNRIYGQISPSLNLYIKGSAADNDLSIDVPYTIWESTGKTDLKSWIGVNAGVFIRLNK